MNPRLTRLLTVAAAAAIVIGVPSAAHADDAPVGRLDHVESKGDKVQVLFSVPGLPADVTPDPATVQVTMDGDPIDATAEVQSNGSAVLRTSILTIDVSNSMAGDRFEAAKAAAAAYIDAAPADVNIGLVTFASTVETVEAPTQDHDALRAAIESLQLTNKTRLYDGVTRALSVAGTEGSRTILLLSDGADNSGAKLAPVLTAASKSDVRIDVVGLNQDVSADSALGQIAAATEGSVESTSDLDKLRAVFAEEADDLAKQLLVTFTAPPSSSGSVSGTLSVSIEADGLTYSDDAFVALTSSDAESATPELAAAATPGFSVSGPWLIGGVLCMFAGLALLLTFGLNQLAPKPASAMQQQLSLYTVHGMRRTEPAPVAGEGVDLKASAVRLADHLAARGNLEDRIAKKLDAGGLKLKPAEWLLLHAGIAVGAAFAGLLFSGANPLVIVLFLAFGTVLPWFYLSFKASRRIKNFNGGLAETLQILAGGLQAGLSLSQAVDTIVREGTEPIASEFHRAIVEQRLGVSIEDSLETVAERMESIDFKWVVMAIRIQREVGGNLAELLLNVSATLREREYLRRQVSVLSAEGRLSAWILGGLPPFFITYLTLTRPTYVAPLYHTTIGWMMLGMMGTMMLVGVFWLKKSVKVEV